MSESLRVDRATLQIDQSVRLTLDMGETSAQISATIDAISSDSLILRLADDQPMPTWLEAGQALDLVVVDRTGMHRGTVHVIRVLEGMCHAMVTTIPLSIQTTQNRESVRIPAKLPSPFVVTRSWNADAVGQTDTLAVTHDLSATGIRIVSRLAVQVGDRIRIQLTPREEEPLVSVWIPPSANVAGFRTPTESVRPSASRQTSTPRAGRASAIPSARSMPSARPVPITASLSIRSIAAPNMPSTRASDPFASYSPPRGLANPRPVITRSEDAPWELDAEVVRFGPAAVPGDFWIAARFCDLRERDESRIARLVYALQRKERQEQS